MHTYAVRVWWDDEDGHRVEGTIVVEAETPEASLGEALNHVPEGKRNAHTDGSYSRLSD